MVSLGGAWLGLPVSAQLVTSADFHCGGESCPSVWLCLAWGLAHCPRESPVNLCTHTRGSGDREDLRRQGQPAPRRGEPHSCSTGSASGYLLSPAQLRATALPTASLWPLLRSAGLAPRPRRGPCASCPLLPGAPAILKEGQREELPLRPMPRCRKPGFEEGGVRKDRHPVSVCLMHRGRAAGGRRWRAGCSYGQDGHQGFLPRAAGKALF